jgi:hypothetical protein
MPWKMKGFTMSAQHSARVLPMQTAGTHHFIERTYRESSAFQWVREVLVNAFEAKATRVEFGIEWQAVENLGVYRRMIVDNGIGMTADQLVEFFNTFGGGGKPIGGAHENFGVGSKTSLLPWNHYGMVVISWVNGDASMIWVTRNPETDEYGLKLEECEGPFDSTWEEVYAPYDDPANGCNWATVKPDWITDHGTVIVLLGNTPTTDTIEGDPGRPESDIKGISSFLNRRFWEIPSEVEVFVDELRTAERALWPPSEGIAHGPTFKDTKDRRTNTREILGARHYVEYENPRFTQGKLGPHGTVPLGDGTEIDWYLWDGERPKVHSYAAIGGYIAAIYNGELYDLSTHHSTYRSFGISESAVRSKLWLVIRPVVDPEGRRGVYPRTDRSALLIKGGPGAGAALPINDWASEFADNMPADLIAALKECRHGHADTLTDEEWREKLKEKFGSRWRIPRLQVKPRGGSPLDPTNNEPPTPKRQSKRSISADQSSATGNRHGQRTLRFGKPGGSLMGDPSQAGGGLPHFRPVGAEDVGDGMLAAWQPKDPEYPEGVVLINVDHSVLRSVIEHWQSQFADHYAEDIERDVITVYGQVAVAKIAHSEHLKGILPSHIVEKQLRADSALTMSLLGLMAEDQLIATRVGGKYSKKRLTVVPKPAIAQKHD